ncbi:MAG TPA: SDR family oxidoreductase, partial [Polyangiaceae bacterium]|nr:SDR family oxidoreductase [Polyangiaceae bacterium]
DEPELRVRDQLRGKELVVIGGTGFLGKVWLSLLLSRVPEVGHVHLVVRPKEGLSVSERFTTKVLTSEVFAPLREQHGADFERFVSSKVTPVPGDVSLPGCGLPDDLRARLVGRIGAVVNVAGIVDFDPPLDEALSVNAKGCQNLVALCRELGDVPLLHTSTCFTAGSRTGFIAERDPRQIPFPAHERLPAGRWDPNREVAECEGLVALARRRFAEPAAQERIRKEVDDEADERGWSTDRRAEEHARRGPRLLRRQLAALGMERAKHWGWPNTYTYTKSLGEQLVANSGLPFTIVRPAIVESTLAFPSPGWNEGINTSSPFIFLIRQGGLQIPGSQNNLDLIPCDLVCVAILLALSELLEGRQRPVYQAAASDLNPCSMARFFELSGLHKRSLYEDGPRGSKVVSALQKRFESFLLSKRAYEAYGPRRLGRGAELAQRALEKAARGPLQRALQPVSRGLEAFASQQQRLARVMDTFLPFVAEYQYVFSAAEVRRAFARLSPAEQELFPWHPDRIDWREWFLGIHAPALERHVFPEMEARLRRSVPPRA